MERLKCLIIGSGPAAYTAAIYAARANLNPVVIEGLQPGGQLTTTTDVENFPGYPEGITGPEMMEDLKKQAQRFGSDVRFGLITDVDFSTRPFKIKGDPGIEIETDSVIIATGASAKYLGLESEEEFKGRGVSACATCDGFFYKGKDVAVVGGGDSAAEEATYLAGLARKVYIIVRKDHMRASKAMQARVDQTSNIEMLYQHTTKEILGDDMGVTGVLLHNSATGEDVEIKVDGFFLGIGHIPNSGPFKDFLKTDEIGYIITEPDSSRTNIPGVFACGDVQDNIYRQAITAAGSGCKAALDAEKYLAEKDIVETDIINE
ncbi:MAG: thioredoxin-disulfide reductase [Bacteroidota bacterium]